MNRRDTIKSLLLGSVATGLVINGCSPNISKEALPKVVKRPLYGRTPSEKLRDKQIYNETFLNKEELSTIAVLCDIILPKNDKYGSATDAGVKEFIDFIVKDMTYQQTPIRGGLMWLNNYSSKLYHRYFTSKMGIKDLGYKGNTPNVWDGVPDEVLKDHGMKYDKKWLAKCVDQGKRDIAAKWDDKGNLIS